MLVAGRTAIQPEGCFQGLACEAVGKGNGNIGHRGENRAKDGRFETLLVHQIYGIQPNETGVYRGRGAHTTWRHGTRYD